jgi:formylglycine-generating enzyme required for sulfatase activity/predicted Ser/Thr protein kinase
LAVDVGTVERACAPVFTTPDQDRLAALMPDFEFQELIGRGGMGAVYRVRQTQLGRLAALKVLPPERAADPAFVERFFREAQALAQLSHTNIVNVYDMGQRGPYLYILMEYVNGHDLRDRIRDKTLDPAVALRIVTDLCAAVQYAHEQGIVHRDIKPENVLITAQNQVKLLDFGIVKLACDSELNRFTLTEINLRMGTPSYMAPEQACGSATLDHRVDIYALGVLLYELLTGELPVLDYTPPSKRVPVDSRIDRVVHHAIRESPAERFQSAADFRREVEHIVKTPRRKFMLGVAAALFIAMCAIGAWSWHRVAAAAPRAPRRGPPLDGVAVAVVPFSADKARDHQQRWADHLGVPVQWTNSIGMDFVLIPPGEYTRGIPEDQLPHDFTGSVRSDIEPTRRAVLQSCIPAHRVRLTRAFYLCTTEVTQRQYKQITGEPIGYFRAGMPGERLLDNLDTADMPAENLSWRMAVDFCKRLGELDGFTVPSLRYRLPTDSEWGFAIRAGTDTPFWYGTELDEKGVYEVSSDCPPHRHPMPVGSRKPNPFGLFDMAGNVSEYCSDWWAPDYFQRYANRCALDSTGPEDGIPGGMQRVVRGGHFGIRPFGHLSTERRRHEPTLWINMIGFRVAISANALKLKLQQDPPPEAAPQG